MAASAGSRGTVADPPFRFERERDPRRRTPADAEADLDALLQRLAVSRPHHQKRRELLLPLVIESHLNIAWYQRAAAASARRGTRLLAAGWALLVAVPLCAWGLAHAGGTAPAVAAILAGAAGLQQTTRAAREARRTTAAFRGAAAALKTRLYRFETAWRRRTSPARGAPDPFAEAVQAEIHAARTIVDAEQQAFFNLLADAPPPTLAATSRRAEPAAHRQALTRASIEQAQHELAGLEDLIAQRRADLNHTRNDDLAQSLITSLEALETRRQALELHLATQQQALLIA
jgi:hypothetical protein